MNELERLVKNTKKETVREVLDVLCIDNILTKEKAEYYKKYFERN